MSVRIDLDSGPLSQETIDDLLTRLPVERVEYFIAEAKARADEYDQLVEDTEPEPESADESETESADEPEPGYSSWTADQLRGELELRGLAKSGSKAELVQRLEGDDARRTADGG